MSTAIACSCTPTTATNFTAASAPTLEIQFLSVEMDSATGTKGCSSCDTARSRLDAAIDAVGPALDAVGVRVAVSEQFVETEREVRALRLTGSPTIRVGGVELKPEHRGVGEDGRVWSWNGEKHELPPQAMLVDAILRGYAMQRVNGGIGSPEVPPYIRQFLKPEQRGRTLAASSPDCECSC
jgi:hypothetical protein